MRVFPHGTIAVVGNAPSEIGLGRGSEIDAHESVIRFNNFQLAGHEADYGMRTTHWASCFYPDVLPRSENFQRILCTTPMLDERFIYYHVDAQGHSLPDYAGLVNAIQARNNVEVVPYDIIRKIGIRSAGLTVLAWIYFERGRTLDGIYLFGFSFFDKARPHHYFQDLAPVVGENDHNGQEEKELFSLMCKGKL
jgi:hypothetical protein